MTVHSDLPIGAIIMWGGTDNVPGGWLLCDGASYGKAAYKALYNAIGDSFGPSGSTEQFCVPDLRGRFVRGVDDRTALNNDPDHASRINPKTNAVWPQGNSLVGSYQADEFRSHTHSYNLFPNKGPGPGQAEGYYWGTIAANTGAAGGSETRPVNLFLHFIIKSG